MSYSPKPKEYDVYFVHQRQRAESKWGRRRTENNQFIDNLRATIAKASDIIGQPESICCMGSRAGVETVVFKQSYPAAEVTGVDITENIFKIPPQLDIKYVLQDFNKLPDDWTDKYDLVFSNSLDHAFDPAATLAEWRRVGKLLLLELSTHPPTNLEHQFTPKLVKSLFADMEILEQWPTPERNIVTVLAR